MEITITRISGLRATANYFKFLVQPRLIGKFFDINNPIGF